MIALGVLLDLLQVAALVGFLWVLTKPVNLSPERAWTLRVVTATTLILVAALHLAIRTHLIALPE